MKQFGFFDGVRNPFSNEFWRKQDELASYVYDQNRLIPSIQRAVGYERTDRGDGGGGGQDRNWFYAYISTATIMNDGVDDEDGRWAYNWFAVTLDTRGANDVPPYVASTDWAVASPALSNDTTNLKAINLAEWNNTAALGPYGLALSTSEGTLTVEKIPVGTIVVMHKMAQADDKIGYVFEAYNPMSLVCA